MSTTTARPVPQHVQATRDAPDEAPTLRVRTRRALDMDGQEATVLVTRASYGGEPQEVLREQIRAPVFRTDPARIRVSGSATRNLGDFNSCRVEVTVELPCYAEASEMERAYNIASALVNHHIRNELVLNGAELPES